MYNKIGLCLTNNHFDNKLVHKSAVRKGISIEVLDMADATRVEKDASDFIDYNQKINLNKTADLTRDTRMPSPKVNLL